MLILLPLLKYIFSSHFKTVTKRVMPKLILSTLLLFSNKQSDDYLFRKSFPNLTSKTKHEMKFKEFKY